MITIGIRRNSDGAIRAYEDPHYDKWEDAEFMWTDGNFRCDCNRHMLFERIGGQGDPDDCPCGETLYSLSYVIDDDSERVDFPHG